VAPHGAGMTNMIWMRPGTSVVMFPMKPYNDNCFGALAMSLDLDFWAIPQIHSYYYGVYPEMSANGLDAVINVVQTILTERRIKPSPR